MEKEIGPFYYYIIFTVSSFLSTGICIVERSYRGAAIFFILFSATLLLALRKKRKLRKKELLQKSP
ncbi:hypothetical protein [Niallia sp. 03133]|uniref:hypothetical protein n=1 Tax=Niallia sp. 03133 TaxID=3458060 RepID=UPI00404447BF